MTQVSARPDNLEAYCSNLEPADRDLQSMASALQQTLEAYRTRCREFSADHTALAHELGTYAAGMAERDAWVGRVGEAFRRADRAPGEAPEGVVLTTDESMKAAEEAMKAEEAAALRRIREALDPGFWGVGHNDLVTIRETLRGLSPSQLDAVIGQLTDEELERWFDHMNAGWLMGGMSDNERREVLNPVAASASLETIQRLSDRTGWVRDYFRPSVEDTDAWEDGQLEDLTCSRIDGDLFAQGEGEANAIDPSDVQQQALGDCYLMASLAAIAQRDPEALRRMIQATPTGRTRSLSATATRRCAS